MNKKQLVAEVSRRTNLPNYVVSAVLDVIVDTIIDTISKGEFVKLVGFGTFSLSIRKGRGVDIQTTLDSTYRLPKFKAGKTFKNIVNI